MKAIPAISALLLLACATSTSATAQAAIDGRWVNPKGSVVVHISPCGEAYCGKVIEANAKAKASARKGGTPSLIGTQILKNLRPVAAGVYKGQVFDPKRNIRAPATIRLVGASALVVRGCMFGGIICKEQRWTRAN